jgi:hypothetical protein
MIEILPDTLVTRTPFAKILERGSLNEIFTALIETHNDQVAAGLECRGASFAPHLRDALDKMFKRGEATGKELAEREFADRTEHEPGLSRH